MAHIIWNEEEQQLPQVKLEPPTVTQQDVDDEKDAAKKQALKDQQQRETNTNEQVHA